MNCFFPCIASDRGKRKRPGTSAGGGRKEAARRARCIAARAVEKKKERRSMPTDKKGEVYVLAWWLRVETGVKNQAMVFVLREKGGRWG